MTIAAQPAPDALDHRVILHAVSWADYERILAVRGEHTAVRMAYLEGDLELMSPSRRHEILKEFIGRLLEAYAEERAIDLVAAGSWTIRSEPRARGVEPDKCYIIGDAEDRTEPDLAIEVVWTSGGIDKLQLYAGLGVREVWFWERGTIVVHVLRGDRYEQPGRSELFAELDLAELSSFLDRKDQTRAVRDYRNVLRR